MMKYNRKTDTLTNTSKPIDPYYILLTRGDFVWYDNEMLYKIKNAHKYVNIDILEEMTEDNDYYVTATEVMLNPEDEFNPSIIKFIPRYRYSVSIYKKVINMIPCVDFEDINESSKVKKQKYHPKEGRNE